MSEPAPDEETLMRVLSALGITKIDIPKLSEVTGIPIPVLVESLERLISRGLVADGYDDFGRFYYLTKEGNRIAQRL
jgi:predicted transcriptional regulator